MGCQCGKDHSVDQLEDEFDLPQGMHELLREGAGRPRLETFGDSYLLRVNRVTDFGGSEFRIESLHVIFHRGWLVVFDDPDGVGTAWHPGPEGRGQYFSGTQSALTLTLIIDSAIASFKSALRLAEEGVVGCEAGIFGDIQRDIASVYNTGSEVSSVKSSLAALCRFLDVIPEPGGTTGSQWSVSMLQFADDAKDILAQINGLHARLTQLVAVHSTLIAEKQNEDMKRISAWAAILFTPSLVGAVYGMNFKNIPELQFAFGYPLALAAMLAIGIVLYVVFRRQRWL